MIDDMEQQIRSLEVQLLKKLATQNQEIEDQYMQDINIIASSIQNHINGNLQFKIPTSGRPMGMIAHQLNKFVDQVGTAFSIVLQANNEIEQRRQRQQKLITSAANNTNGLNETMERKREFIEICTPI